MPSSDAEPTVRNDPEAHRYEIREGDTVLGIAAYDQRGDTLVFTHTEVDSSSEHPKLGSRLVKAALDDVRSHGQRVVAQCSFVRGWIDRHPDYADLVAQPEH